MTDLTPEQIAHRANHAKTFLGSDAWTEVQERCDRQAWESFKNPDSTPQDREALWTQVQAFATLSRVLRAIAERAPTLDTD